MARERRAGAVAPAREGLIIFYVTAGDNLMSVW
jgi:hypothetical protein